MDYLWACLCILGAVFFIFREKFVGWTGSALVIIKTLSQFRPPCPLFHATQPSKNIHWIFF
jgi:hypothetical protein